MNTTESKALICPNCRQQTEQGMQFCPHCGHSLLPAKPVEDRQDLQRPIGCFWYVLIGIVAPFVPVVAIYLISSSGIFTQNAIAIIAVLLSLGIYPAIWYFAAKGRYNKVNLFGYLNMVIWSVVPFADWWVVYYLGRGLYMTFSKQELPNPPKATNAGTILLVVIIVISAIIAAFSSSPATQYPTPQPTLTARPTQRPIPPTALPLNFNGLPCVSWAIINRSDLDSHLCIYGIVYTYGPYSDKWTFIRFSPKTDAFRVLDFNYYYYSPLNIGDCVIVYGRVRDYGSYLIITPDKDAADSVRVGSSSLCK
jgi:hypothetical protein